MIKCILLKASDSNFKGEVVFEEADDLIDFLREDVECGTVIMEAKKVVRHDWDEKKGIVPVYENLKTPIITIYDDYVE